MLSSTMTHKPLKVLVTMNNQPVTTSILQYSQELYSIEHRLTPKLNSCLFVIDWRVVNQNHPKSFIFRITQQHLFKLFKSCITHSPTLKFVWNLGAVIMTRVYYKNNPVFA
ncbi:hypothetical protein SB14R_18040 [Pseudomonas oryzihabitans]|nr:hypothetical protein NS376_10825 [Pseudomonas psychrotolerans]KTT22294.1 hypothetical protein SB14R_18040 [Pseudomonas psychrotolerans]